MAGQMQESGVGSKQVIMQNYDERTNQALERILAQLPPELHSDVREFVQDCYNNIEKHWSSIMNPQQDEVEAGRGMAGRGGRRAGGNLVMDAGDEDIENPNSPVTSKLHHVQSALTAFLDDSVYHELHKRFE